MSFMIFHKLVLFWQSFDKENILIQGGSGEGVHAVHSGIVSDQIVWITNRSLKSYTIYLTHSCNANTITTIAEKENVTSDYTSEAITDKKPKTNHSLIAWRQVKMTTINWMDYGGITLVANLSDTSVETCRSPSGISRKTIQQWDNSLRQGTRDLYRGPEFTSTSNSKAVLAVKLTKQKSLVKHSESRFVSR